MVKGRFAFYVNVYELDRVYGGPEEGGWWFTTGKLVKTKTADTLEQALFLEEALEQEYQRGTGLQNCGSVLYAGGDYTVQIDDVPGADWPTEYPRYE
jgi:hypothetical protein